MAERPRTIKVHHQGISIWHLIGLRWTLKDPLMMILGARLGNTDQAAALEEVVLLILQEGTVMLGIIPLHGLHQYLMVLVLSSMGLQSLVFIQLSINSLNLGCDHLWI
jgi:hypothetical protein